MLMLQPSDLVRAYLWVLNDKLKAGLWALWKSWMLNTNKAPSGTIWVCNACGKMTENRMRGPKGWDSSCYDHAVLCDIRTIVISEGKVVSGTIITRPGGLR